MKIVNSIARQIYLMIYEKQKGLAVSYMPSANGLSDVIGVFMRTIIGSNVLQRKLLTTFRTNDGKETSVSTGEKASRRYPLPSRYGHKYGSNTYTNHWGLSMGIIFVFYGFSGLSFIRQPLK